MSYLLLRAARGNSSASLFGAATAAAAMGAFGCVVASPPTQCDGGGLSKKLSINSSPTKKEKGAGAMVGDDFQFKLGQAPNSGFSIFLAERTKKIHFIRHAEGEHNVLTANTGSNSCLHRKAGESARDHPLWDARLTEKGINQARMLREYLATRPSGSNPFTAFDLVVVSPLTRTLETAEHIFGPARKPGSPAFLDKGETYQGRAPQPKILVREECRERWGEYVCDGRRAIREIAPEFPNFDFSEIENDEDIFYTEDEREPDELCCERAVLFLEWLNKRPEKCIAVVTHSSFLRHLFQEFGGNTSLDDRDRLKRVAANCELRSVVMCSHGVKDGKELSKSMNAYASTRAGGPASTVDMDDFTPHGGGAGANNAPP